MSAPVVVYEPFRAGLPPLGAYLRSLWARRGATAAPRAAPVVEVEADEVDQSNPFLAAPFTPEPRVTGATV